MKATPLFQGELDGLCGLYAVLNAFDLVVSLNDTHRKALFDAGITYLHQRKILKNAIINGMRKTHILNIIRLYQAYVWEHCNGCVVCMEQDFFAEATYSNRLLTCMREFLALPHRAIIVGIWGKNDHWTCASSITEKLVHFRDSSGLVQLRTHQLTCGVPCTQRPHGVSVKEVFGLYRPD